MLNETHDPDNLRVIATYPTSPAGGGVVVYGALVGIAEGDEDSDGYTVVRFGPWVGDLEVVTSGAIAKGDPLFCTGATPVVLSNISTGYFFGWANEALASGTDTINVIKAGYAGGILSSGGIGTTQLAAHCVTAAKMAFPYDPSAETPGTTTTGTVIKIGTSSTPFALDTAGQTGIKSFYSTTATSDTTHGEYCRLDVSGAGVEGIAGRSKTLLKVASVGNAHGRHDTLELDTSAGNVTGLGTGHRGNLVVADRAVAAGTYYGAMAEIYPLGNSAALPATSNACLGINSQTGTAMDLVANAISFSGADGTGKMIDTSSVTPTYAGSIRILVNGAIRYLYWGTNAT
jgi:hypothetical protein